MSSQITILEWLEDIGMEDFAAAFNENEITVDLLPSLTNEDLRELGVTALGKRKKLLAAIAALSETGKGGATPQAAAASEPPVPSTKNVPSAPGPPPRPSVASTTVVAEAPDAAEIPEPGEPLVVGSKARRKGFSPGFLSVSIGLHVVLGLLATYWVVQTIQAERKLQFKGGPPNPSPNTRALEHKVSMQKKKNSGGAPAQPKRIAVAGMTANITLPDMPTMPSMSGQIALGQMSGMGGAGFGQGLGFGNGMGSGMGGGTGMGGINFFGFRSQSKSVLFVLDSSQSNVGGPGGGKSPKTYRALEEEVFKALRGLTPQSRFSVILYAPKLWVYSETMVSATPSERDKAIEFIKKNSVATAREKGAREFGEHSGTRMDLAIEKAFKLKPELIFWVSDGMPTPPPDFKGGKDMGKLLAFLLKQLADEQKSRSPKIKINTIAYKLEGKGSGLEEARKFMNDIAARNDGTFKEVE